MRINNNKNLEFSRSTWRNITNLWTILTIMSVVVNFFSQNIYASSVTVISNIYLAVLGIYTSTKEFERWKEDYSSGRYLGELSAIAWTIVVVSLIIISIISGGKYVVNQEVTFTYVIMLVILAITSQSKFLYKKTRRK